MRRAKYHVYTWDTDKQEFTPQKGVRCGPYTLFGLRKAIRKLRAMGYDGRRGDNSVAVEKEELDKGLYPAADWKWRELGKVLVG